MKELDRLTSIAAAISSASSLHAQELNRTTIISATITVTTVVARRELDRLVSIAVDVTTLNVQAHKELLRLTSSVFTITATDQISTGFKEFDRLVSIDVSTASFHTVARRELDRPVSIAVTTTSSHAFRMAEFRAALLLFTIFSTSRQSMVERPALVIAVAVSVTDQWITALPAGAYTRPYGTITDTAGGGVFTSSRPSAEITRRQL